MMVKMASTWPVRFVNPLMRAVVGQATRAEGALG
jgi:hypothetical protein